MSRYVDLDELIERTQNDPVGKVLAKEYNLIGFLEWSPVADVKPVVHAHMIEYVPRLYECSACGWNMVEDFYRYCPNCGAKMDEEAE